MTKEIDQRLDRNRIIIECNCGAGDHFFLVEWSAKDEFDLKSLTMATVQRPGNLWWRIQKALQYIWDGGDLYYHDIDITSSDCKKIIKLMQDYTDA